MASVSGTLLLLSHNHWLTVEWLIGLTFVGGVGAALFGPAWQAIVPELVPRHELKMPWRSTRWASISPGRLDRLPATCCWQV